MNDVREVVCRPGLKRPVRRFVVSAAGAVVLAGVWLVVVGGTDWGGGRDVRPYAGAGVTLAGIVFLHWAVAQVRADAYGVHARTVLRRRSVPWGDIADLRVHVQRGRHGQELHRVGMLLRDGRTRRLPVPVSASPHDRPAFDARLDALRALHRRYGAPESEHVPVISYRTAGRGTALPLGLGLLLLAGAVVAAWYVPVVQSEERAWASAVPCTAEENSPDCLTTLSAEISRVEVGTGKERSRLYFADARPQDRLVVSQEGAEGFRAGQQVEVVLWRGQVREVSGGHHVWRENVVGGGEVAVAAAVCLLGSGYAGSVLLVRRRGRRLPDDEVVPSAVPFAVTLAGTAVWLLPLIHLNPSGPPDSVRDLAWAGAGTLASLGLFVRAWRVTRVRPLRQDPGGGRPRGSIEEAHEDRGDASGEDVFLAARFLESTDYNPHGFGTHVVLGGGPPAVTPHAGPGRFGAKPIPVERLTFQGVRRLRGGDDDTVPRHWDVAEFDDGGRTVRLVADPDDLDRIVRAIRRAAASGEHADASYVEQ